MCITVSSNIPNHVVLGYFRKHNERPCDFIIGERITEMLSANATFPEDSKSYSFIVTNLTFNLPSVKDFIKKYGFTCVARAKGKHTAYLNFFFRDSIEDR